MSFTAAQTEIENLAADYIRRPAVIALARLKDPSLNEQLEKAAIDEQPLREMELREIEIKGLTEAEFRELKKKSAIELLLVSHPSIIALAAHEKAHALYAADTIPTFVKARELAIAAAARADIAIDSGTVIGEGTWIEAGATLSAYGTGKLANGYPIIGKSCTLSAGAKLSGNIKAGDNVTIGPDAALYGNAIVLGDNVTIGTGVKIYDGNQLAAKVTIGEGAVIPANTGLIDRNIPAHTVVNRDTITGELEFGAAEEKKFVNSLSSVTKRSGASLV